MPTSQRATAFRVAAPTLWLAVACALLLAPALSPPTRAQAPEEARLEAYGRHLAQECTSCHRGDGVDNGIPSIAGWDADSFVRTLKFYRDGARTNPVMVSVASSLDEQQMRALALYWSSLPRPAKPAR